MSARTFSPAGSRFGLFTNAPSIPLVISLVIPLVIASSIGCGSKPPPPAPPPVAAKPPPKPEPIDVPPPPPPPPPKCEAMTESCVADKSTVARIAHSPNLAFTPPSGWRYAQEEAATVAQLADDGPALAVAFSAAVGKEPTKRYAALDAALAALSGRLGLKLPKQKLVWKKADKVDKLDDRELDLYQIEGAHRGGKKGPLLVFVAHVSEVDVVVGVAFVDDDDKTDADGAVFTAIRSIATVTAPAEKPTEKSEKPAEKKDEKKEEKKP